MEAKTNLLVIGGAGFIGYHIVLQALDAGYKVSIMNRSLPSVPDFFPETVTVYQNDAVLLPEEEMEEMFRQQDILVYAIGADDKYLPAIPAYTYYHLHNVQTTAKICRIAKKAGIKKVIILGSYFSYFNRIWPEMQLSAWHPYIRSRVEQEKIAVEYSSPDMEIVVLELPYIFGYTKGRIPLWKPLLDYILSSFPLFYMQGGSNMVSVKVVASAVLGAIKYRSRHGEVH